VDPASRERERPECLPPSPPASGGEGRGEEEWMGFAVMAVEMVNLMRKLG